MLPLFGPQLRFLYASVRDHNPSYTYSWAPTFCNLHAPARNGRHRESTSRDYTLIRYSSVCQAIAISFDLTVTQRSSQRSTAH